MIARALPHVLIFALLGVGLCVSYAADIAVWALPGRFLYDCDNGLTAEQKVIVRNSGLPALGIYKKCARRVCEADRCALVANDGDKVVSYGTKGGAP